MEFNTNKTDQTYTLNREPVLIGDCDDDSNAYCCLSDIGLTTAQFEQNMIEDFKKMAVSTYNYGGFWIGRYETSLSDSSSTAEGKDGTMQSKRNMKSLKASSKRGNGHYYRWYGLYDKQKTQKANYSTHMYWRM